MDKACNCNDIIRGIKCSFSNCAYHTADDQCGAGHINVGPSNAQVENDTKCATFEAKF